MMTWYLCTWSSTEMQGCSEDFSMSRVTSASACISSGVTSSERWMKNVCSSVVPLSRYVTSDSPRSS